ncbi:MAG TPA: non-ribosomal peptide synthetase [Rhodanobacteraceae bacterium]|nr:non-ribosomal peptide synthetase [Rhodanobacteraceae bacterium]
MTDAGAKFLAGGNPRNGPAGYANASPDSIAIVHEGNALDYRGLHEAVDRVAAGLLRRGLGIDDIVAFSAARDPACMVLLLAIRRAGGVCLPLDPNYPDARLHAMLEDARPRLVVAPERERNRWPEDLPWCAREGLDTESGASIPGFPTEAARLAYILFTSGSTGRPKGVAMRSAAFDHLIDWHFAHPRLGMPARTLQFAPLGFDVAFQEIFSTFGTGGTLVLPSESERRDPYALLALLAREKIERLFVPYVALQAIAEATAGGGENPTQLRDVVTAGEQLRITPAIRAMFGALSGCVLHNQYGPTETHVVTAHELAGDPAAWPDLPPIGRPLPHVTVRVADESLEPVTGGAEGELLLGGGCLAAGYINRPELSAERFIERDGERWYRTGDLVRCDDNDELEFLGRVDTQIKVGGYRIEPGEIETVLARHAAIAEVVVVAGGAEPERKLVAHVVSRDRDAEENELVAQWRAHCRERLADYLVPQQFVVHAALPLTASGKIDRRALEHDGAQAPLNWPESAPLEEQLRSLWQQLLDIRQLDLHANVFDHGARSLTVIRALNELRRRGFRSLGAAQIYEHPNVAAMAAMLRGETEGASGTADMRARGRDQRAALARFAPRSGRA